MKAIFTVVVLLSAITSANAQYRTHSNSGLYGGGLSGIGSNPSSHYVSPHLNSSGSYIGGYHQTNPNNTQLDNYGTRGNINPYTGAVGRRGARY